MESIKQFERQKEQDSTLKIILEQSSKEYPFPIAYACRKCLDNPPKDSWREWETLSCDILNPILQYLSHLLLSDLVALGQKPAHLYHRIQSILSRPMVGHYAGFLRETAGYYRENNLQSAIPELIDFLLKSEVETTLTEKKEPLIGKLVDYRNLFAHGRIENEEVVEEILSEVRKLTILLLKAISFLKSYSLELADGAPTMGSDVKVLSGKPQPVLVRVPGKKGLVLRPLLLKLKKQDLVLLEDHDLRSLKIVYKGSTSYEQFRKKQIKSGEGKDLLEELKTLLSRVRSEEAVLAAVDWESFRERVSVISERTLSLYEDMHKYVPKWYVPRPEWEGKESIFEEFLHSEKTLLAINGVQGSGKSALVSHLASKYLKEDHAVLLINAQRFSFADVTWSGNPYMQYFSEQLHYEKPFDRSSFKRLVKTASEENKVIFFIDAINEVDGIENKWNRFRAMELMLEWIAEVAQPGVKFVLSFRLEEYEEFEYLQDEELPKNLREISYPGDNPRKDWVRDLKPFDITQAERLFGKLQEYPELGMAPLMSWENVKESLGDKIEEFTTNPLIFTILLKSHHKQHRLEVKDINSLFMSYAENLTGAAEVKKFPWWKKVIGFIKNGNITPKEQFLADLIEKTTQQGGASFLVESLNLKKNKTDRRMSELINNPKDTSFKDLKESGLIVEEKIELEREGKQSFSRRITFVAELMVSTLDNFYKKIEKIKKFRNFLFLISFILLVYPIIFSTSLLMLFNKLHKHLLELGLNKQLISLITKSVSFVLIKDILIIFIIIGFFYLSMKETKLKVSDIDLISMGFGQYTRRKFSIIQKSYLLYVTLFSIVLFILLSPIFLLDYPLISVSPLIGLIFSLLIVLFIPPLFVRLLKIADIKCPPKIIKMCSKNYLKYYKSKKYLIRFNRMIMKLIFSGVLILIVVQILSKIWFKIDYSNFPKIIDMNMYYAYGWGNMINIVNIWNNTYLSKVLYLLFISLILFITFYLFFDKFRQKYFFSVFIKNPYFFRKKRSFLKIVLFNMSITIIFIFLAIWICSVSKNSQSEQKIKVKKFIEVCKLPESKYKFNEENELIELDLTDTNLNKINALKELKLDQLESLKLPKYTNLKIDLRKFPKLTKLQIPSYLISDFNFLKGKPPFTLILYDPENFLSNINNINNIIGFCALGKTSRLERLPKVFPNLLILGLDEEAARKTADKFPDLNINLTLELNENKAPLLDWLNSKHARLILRLKAPINDKTHNIELIKRLIMLGDGFQPKILEKASNLEWLFLSFKNKISSHWLKELKKVVKDSLPKLKSLEFCPYRLGEEKFNLNELHSALGKEEILNLLDRLIENPDLIFVSSLDN